MILEMLRFWYPVECPTDGNKLDCGILALRTVEEQVLGQIWSKFKSHVLETHPKGAKTNWQKRSTIAIWEADTVMQRKIARPYWYEIDMQYLLALTFLFQCLQSLGNVLATDVFSWPTNRETSRDWIYGFGCEARSSGRDTPAETMFPSELLSSSSRISPGPGRVWAIVGHCRSDRRNFPTAGGTRPVPCKRWLEIRRQGRC